MWKRSFRNARSTGSTSVYSPRYAFSCSPGTVSVTSASAVRGRGHAGLAEEGEGERLACLGGVERPALKLHRVQPVEIRVIGAVQIDQEGTLQAPGRRHVGGVPRVAEADALVTSCLPP